jgi:Ca-activated chloride channel family protein
MAEKTGGLYYRARSSADLEKIYSSIDKLEKTEMEVKEYNSFDDIFEKFLWIILGVFLVELILANTVLFRIN